MLQRHLARESFLEGLDNLTHLLGAVMDELEPKVTDTSIEPQLDVLCGNLRLGPEDRVAAPHIRHHGVPASGMVLERYTVRFTWMPAVGVVGVALHLTVVE
jgi:hypothetical protein